jgi:hypothetical protein
LYKFESASTQAESDKEIDDLIDKFKARNAYENEPCPICGGPRWADCIEKKGNYILNFLKGF